MCKLLNVEFIDLVMGIRDDQLDRLLKKTLLKHRSKVMTECDDNGEHLLFKIVRTQDTDFAEILKETVGVNWIDVKERTENYEGKYTLLDIAVNNQDNRMIAWLCSTFKSEINVQELNEDGESVYHIAARNNNLEALKLFYEEFGVINVNQKTNDGNTVVHIAVQNKYLEIIKWLCSTFKSEINVQELNQGGESVYHNAAEIGNLAVLKFLHEEIGGINVNQKRNDGNTVVHLAMRNERLDIIKWLCSNFKSEINVQELNERGESIYHIAAKCGNLGAMKIFHEEFGGIYVNQKTYTGNTVVHFAMICKFLEIIKWLSSTFKSEINMQELNKDGESVFHIAARLGNLEAMNILHKEVGGIDVNQKTQHGNTVVHLAVENEHLEIIKWLSSTFKSEIDVQELNEDGESAFHITAKHANLDAMKFLHEEFDF